MERQGIEYLIEYGETGEANIFLPVGMDITKFIRRFYPHIPEGYNIHRRSECIEDGMWVKITNRGYEDTNVFLPSGENSIVSQDELTSMYIYFFKRATNFMKKPPHR